MNFKQGQAGRQVPGQVEQLPCGAGRAPSWGLRRWRPDGGGGKSGVEFSDFEVPRQGSETQGSVLGWIRRHFPPGWYGEASLKCPCSEPLALLPMVLGAAGRSEPPPYHPQDHHHPTPQPEAT